MKEKNMRIDKKLSISQLIMIRIYAAGSIGETVKKITNSIKPVLSSPISDNLWQNSIIELQDNSLVEKVSAEKNSKKKERYRLTDEGKKQVESLLNASYFPKKLSWQKMRDKYLAAMAINYRIDSDKSYRKFTPGRIKAMILAQYFNLSFEEIPTREHVRNALCWKAIGENSSKAFNKTNAFPYIITLLQNVDNSMKGKINYDLLVAQATGARNASLNTINNALVSIMISSSNSVLKTEIESPQSFDLNSFSQQVQKIANESPTGRFGSNHVFISHVWQYFRKTPFADGMSEIDFKQHLLDAHRARLLNIVEEDLPDRRDPNDIQSSAIPYLNTVFHYVRTT